MKRVTYRRNSQILYEDDDSINKSVLFGYLNIKYHNLIEEIKNASYKDDGEYIFCQFTINNCIVNDIVKNDVYLNEIRKQKIDSL